MIALDTNLLIYAHREGTPQHLASRRAIERASESNRGWGVAYPCVTEFWSVATQASPDGGASSPAIAEAFLKELFSSGGGELWLPCANFSWRLCHIAKDRRITGPRIFDLQVALIAFDNGASQIWTHDKNFISIPGLRVVDPLNSK